jgi:hypothetical protein
MTEQEQTSIVLSPKQTDITEWEVLKARPTLFHKRLSMMIVNGNRLTPMELEALGGFALTNDLNPFNQECYYLPGTGPIAGIAGYRRKAHQQLEREATRANHGGPVVIWMDPPRPAVNGVEGVFGPNDIAIFVTIHDTLSKAVWLSSMVKLAKDLKDLGVPNPWGKAEEYIGPEPVWTGVGVVFKSESFAKEGKPEKYDRIERATKRAEKIALRKRFQMMNIQDLDAIPYDEPDIKLIEEPQKKRPALNEGKTIEQLTDDLFGTNMEAERKAMEAVKNAVEKPAGPIEGEIVEPSEPDEPTAGTLKERVQQINTPTEPKPAEKAKAIANKAKAKREMIIDAKAYVKEHAEHCQLPTSKQSSALAACLDAILGNSVHRYEFMSALAGKEVKTSSQIPDLRQLTALFEWLKPYYDEKLGKFLSDNEPAKLAIIHAHAAWTGATML